MRSNNPGPSPARGRGRPNLAILLVPPLLMTVSFLFWYRTWFGRPLSNQQMAEYLADTSVPHNTQHALAQIGDRIARGDKSVSAWYPQVLALAGSAQPQFRLTAAWVMGQDATSAEFHQALRKLLLDSDPAVRLNAALALVRFQDAAGEPELRLMLHPFTVRAPLPGTVKLLVKKGDSIGASSIVARINDAAPKPHEVSTSLGGEVEDLLAPDGTTVAADAPLLVLSPGTNQAWECLRGLYFVGRAQDVGEIGSFLNHTPRLPERVKQQAESTIQAIRNRATLQQTQR